MSHTLAGRTPKTNNANNIVGWILFAKEKHDFQQLSETYEADSQYIEHIYKMVTGQEKSTPRSIGSYAKDIKNYLESIIAHMPGNVYWMNRNCVYLGCNDNVSKALGLSNREEIVGKTYGDFAKLGKLTKQQNESFRHDDLEVMNTGEPKLNVEEPPVTLTDGSVVYYLSSRVPLFDTKRNVIGVVGISMDITDLKKAEQKLQEARIKDKVQAEKIRTMQSLGAAIAHELRTPLRAIISNARGVERYLPRLIESYQLAKDAGISIASIQPRHLESLKYTLSSIQGETHFSNTIIDMLLLNIKAEKIDPTEFEVCSIVACVEEALERYPFTVTERRLVSWNNKNDFDFMGKSLLITHVLFNLIKNSLYYIAKARKGGINIWLTRGKCFNRVHFKDTGTGIAPNILPRIFDEFFSKTHNGTGIGLSFCKIVMESLSGEITCISQEGEFTEFILTFPQVLHKSKD